MIQFVLSILSLACLLPQATLAFMYGPEFQNLRTDLRARDLTPDEIPPDLPPLNFETAYTVEGPLVGPDRIKQPRMVFIPPEDASTDVETIDIPDISLRELLLPSVDCDPDHLTGAELAYIGGAVYSLFLKCQKITPSSKKRRRHSDLQLEVDRFTCAPYKHQLLKDMQSEFGLTARESNIVQRGRNSGQKKHNRGKNPQAQGYAVGLNALIGYTYISNQDRCYEILSWIANNKNLDARKP